MSDDEYRPDPIAAITTTLAAGPYAAVLAAAEWHLKYSRQLLAAAIARGAPPDGDTIAACRRLTVDLADAVAHLRGATAVLVVSAIDEQDITDQEAASREVEGLEALLNAPDGPQSPGNPPTGPEVQSDP